MICRTELLCGRFPYISLLQSWMPVLRNKKGGLFGLLLVEKTFLQLFCLILILFKEKIKHLGLPSFVGTRLERFSYGMWVGTEGSSS